MRPRWTWGRPGFDRIDGPGGADPRNAWATEGFRALMLFVGTLLTTSWAGVQLSPRWEALRAADPTASWLSDGRVIVDALSFSGALLAILAAHEAGHLVVGRRNGVRMSWPWFIPWLPPFGTAGAVMRIHTERMSSAALARMAAAGPFWGIAVTVPVLVIGLTLSEVRPLPVDPGAVLLLGDPLLMRGLIGWIVGPVETGHEVFLHPVAFAGWAGCFLTSFNLIPLGQLDGGHLLWVAVGRRMNRMVRWIWWGLVLAGVFLYVGWLGLALLLKVAVGIEHPPLTDDEPSGAERRIALASLVLFVLTFVPVPVGLSLLDALGVTGR